MRWWLTLPLLLAACGDDGKNMPTDGPMPDDMVVTCMPGLKRVAPARYELARSNFRPDRELDVLILQPASHGR